MCALRRGARVQSPTKYYYGVWPLDAYCVLFAPRQEELLMPGKKLQAGNRRHESMGQGTRRCGCGKTDSGRGGLSNTLPAVRKIVNGARLRRTETLPDTGLWEPQHLSHITLPAIKCPGTLY